MKNKKEIDLNIVAPLLADHIQNGTIWKDETGNYIGKASDGQEVSFGFSIQYIENYLKSHPTTDTW